MFARLRCYALLLSVAFAASSSYSQTLASAKAFADAGDWANAAAQADYVVQSGAAHERPEAGAVLMRALGTSGRHTDLEAAYTRAAYGSRRHSVRRVGSSRTREEHAE